VGVIHQAREMGLGMVNVDQPMLGRIRIFHHNRANESLLI